MEILIYAKAGCRDDERGGIDLVEFFKGFGLNVASDCKLAYIGMYLPLTGSKIITYLCNGTQSQYLYAIVLDFEEDIVDRGVSIRS